MKFGRPQRGIRLFLLAYACFKPVCFIRKHFTRSLHHCSTRIIKRRLNPKNQIFVIHFFLPQIPCLKGSVVVMGSIGLPTIEVGCDALDIELRYINMVYYLTQTRSLNALLM